MSATTVGLVGLSTGDVQGHEKFGFIWEATALTYLRI